MVSGLSLSVLPNLRKGFLCNLYHVIEYDDENGVDDFKIKTRQPMRVVCVKMIHYIGLVLKWLNDVISLHLK